MVELGYPEDYKELKQLLVESEAMCENVFKSFALPIHSLLGDLGIDYTFKYRMKSVYSIWKKMRTSHREFDEVYDLFATRIVYRVKEPLPPAALPNAIDELPGVAEIKAQTIQAMDPEKLYVSECFVCPGMTLKRMMPRGKGSADRILKRTSHITVALAEKE